MEPSGYLSPDTMHYLMKSKIICISLITLSVACCFSCSNDGKYGDFKRAKTAAEAREIAAKNPTVGVTDTFFLDYHWGMSKDEVEEMTCQLVKEKRLSYSFYPEYEMTFERIGTITAPIIFDYYKDTLAALFIMPINSKVDILDYVYAFSQNFVDKGYSIFDEEDEPNYHEPAMEFYKGNTSITMVMIAKTYPSIVFRNEYLARKIREDEETEKLHEQQAIKEKATKTKDDF